MFKRLEAHFRFHDAVIKGTVSHWPLFLYNDRMLPVHQDGLIIGVMDKIKRIFRKKDRIAIGAIHLPPLLGYSDFPGLAVAERNALRDLAAFQGGGFDAVIFENNYDVPHREFVSPAVVAAMTCLGAKIKRAAKVPVGISVLWNDYRAALAIAKVIGLQFIRVPVFVDKVETAYCIIEGNPKEVIEIQKQLTATEIALFTDIHVKHAKLLSSYSLEESARRAIVAGSDALIITGQWTGDTPPVGDLETVRQTIGGFPFFVGSGVTKQNVGALCRIANGAIVSTSLKEGGRGTHTMNVKAYHKRISRAKVQSFVRALNSQSD